MKYYLHFVGSKLYPKEIFINEANRVGVNRCLPTRLIKKLNWGDKILLGTFEAKEQKPTCDDCVKCGENTCGNDTKNLSCFEGKLDGRKNKKNGTAKVFGYFIISGLNYNASHEFKAELVSKLTIIQSKEQGIKVQRQCGSYTIGTSYIVKNSIKEIIEKAEEINKVRKENIKFFIAGRFYPLQLELSPINFTRTIIEVNIQALEDVEKEQETVSHLYDYDKRCYIKKQEKRGRPKKEKL